jgi:hypothetical protein
MASAQSASTFERKGGLVGRWLAFDINGGGAALVPGERT